MKTDAQVRRSNFFARSSIRDRKIRLEEWYYGKWKELPDGMWIRSHYD